MWGGPLLHHHLTPQDWDALADDPEFRSLLLARRRFTIPATLFFVAYYLALPVGVGFAPELMNRPAWGVLTVAYVFAISQFLMAWILLAIYMRRARSFDAMAARIVERAKEQYTK